MAITTAQIHAAADQIDKEGKRPTLAGVRTVLGGGSFSTIQAAMATWKKKEEEEEGPAEPVPEDVAEEGGRAIAALWQLAEKHAATAYDMEREEAQFELGRMRGELNDAITAADEQAAKAEKMEEELHTAWRERDTLTYKLVNVERERNDSNENYRVLEATCNARDETIKMLNAIIEKFKTPEEKKPGRGKPEIAK